jgi:hypothetical protein
VIIGSMSGLLSTAIVDFAQRNKIPFLKKAEIRPTNVLGSTTTTQAKTDVDVRLTAEILDAYVNIGGRVLYPDINNLNVSIQLPLGNKAKRNFILEVEKHVDDLGGTTSNNPSYLLARLFYRFTF